MEHPEIGGVVGGGGNKGGEGFIDRNKVRILFCDNNSKSSEEVCRLLCKCSYQVTSVRSARQVIDALNAEGPDIDIILAEVDLPMAKGMKMLKYITRDKGLQRIPVIMMSALDEVSVVVKCLRFGAADYLVKPLRTNELLNLWTHMWRRRRMLGLAEKNIMTYDFDLVVSDPSDANTNSTTLFSDDTDERSRKTANLEASLSTHQEDESTGAATAVVAAVAAVVDPPASVPMQSWPNVSAISNLCTGQFLSGPKKSELKVGESSAFFTYVKSSFTKRNVQAITHAVGGEAAQHLMTREKLHALGGQVDNVTNIHDNRGSWVSHSQADEFTNSSVPDSSSLERSSMSRQFPQERSSNEEQSSQVHTCPGNKPQLDLSGFPPQNAYPYYMSGMGNQVMVPSSKQLYQKTIHDYPATSAMVSQYNPPVHGMASYPYYVSICLQPGQVPTSHPWPSFGSSSTEAKSCKVDRREAALNKFRQKRKERCFDKKIRYVNRKKLAERRPRVRGQFVRKVNGVSVDLNGEPASIDSDEEEYEEQASRVSSPEDESSGYKL